MDKFKSSQEEYIKLITDIMPYYQFIKTAGNIFPDKLGKELRRTFVQEMAYAIRDERPFNTKVLREVLDDAQIKDELYLVNEYIPETALKENKITLSSFKSISQKRKVDNETNGNLFKKFKRSKQNQKTPNVNNKFLSYKWNTRGDNRYYAEPNEFNPQKVKEGYIWCTQCGFPHQNKGHL